MGSDTGNVKAGSHQTCEWVRRAGATAAARGCEGLTAWSWAPAQSKGPSHVAGPTEAARGPGLPHSAIGPQAHSLRLHLVPFGLLQWSRKLASVSLGQTQGTRAGQQCPAREVGYFL